MVKSQEDALENYRLRRRDSTHNAMVTNFRSAVEDTSTMPPAADLVAMPVNNVLLPDPHTLRIEASPSLGARPVEPMLQSLSRRSILCVNASDVRIGDDWQVCRENRTGCARGMMWAIVFQISAAIAIAVCWKLYLLFA